MASANWLNLTISGKLTLSGKECLRLGDPIFILLLLCLGVDGTCGVGDDSFLIISLGIWAVEFSLSDEGLICCIGGDDG